MEKIIDFASASKKYRSSYVILEPPHAGGKRASLLDFDRDLWIRVRETGNFQNDIARILQEYSGQELNAALLESCRDKLDKLVSSLIDRNIIKYIPDSFTEAG